MQTASHDIAKIVQARWLAFRGDVDRLQYRSVVVLPSFIMTENEYLPLGRPDVTESDIDAVNSVLRSGWITMAEIRAST